MDRDHGISDILWEVGIFACLLGIFGLLLFFSDKRIKQITAQSNNQYKSEAMSYIDTRYEIVSGWNETTGNRYSIGIKNLETQNWEVFDVCTQEQQNLKQGDIVEFSLIDEDPATSPLRANKNCYLSIKKSPGDENNQIENMILLSPIIINQMNNQF